jgi:hypothetical protein
MQETITPAKQAPGPDDVVIVHARRTALCKANTGGFKNTPVDELVFAVLKDAIEKTGIEPEVRRPAAASHLRFCPCARKGAPVGVGAAGWSFFL